MMLMRISYKKGYTSSTMAIQESESLLYPVHKKVPGANGVLLYLKALSMQTNS